MAIGCPLAVGFQVMDADDSTLELGHWTMGYDEFIVLDNFHHPRSNDSKRLF